MNKKEIRFSEALMKAVIIILSVILAIGILSLFSVVSDDLRGYSEAEADDFYYALEAGDYVWLGELSRRSMSDQTREEAAGCLAVSDYYEAAVYYKAYADAGREEEAAEEKAKMEALLPTLKEYNLSFAAEDIQTALGLK